jgi:HAD superfamily hydrolase (TIGR01509 family)
MGKIAGIIFDMDGVLIDAKEWHFEALNRALGLFGHVIRRADHLSSYDGLPTRRKLEMLTRERGLPRGLHGLIGELKQQYTTELIHLRCKPTFAHQYALSNLRALGYKLAVASNSVRSTVQLMMEKSDLASYLDLTLSNQDVSKPKPDPEIYATAIARLGMRPEQCLIVEDNEHGLQAARAAGGHVMAVQGVEDVNLPKVLEEIRRVERMAP